MTTLADRIHHRFAKEGFQQVSVGRLLHQGQPQYKTSFDPNWQNFYFEHGFLQIDPLPATAMSERKPVSWADVAKRFPKSEVMLRAADYGISTGFAMSDRGMVVSIADVGKLSESDLNHYYGCLKRWLSQEEKTEVRLTDRERGLLSLVGAGMSEAEIAVIQGVSVSAVKNMKSRLMKRLDVSTIAQAISYLPHI